LSLHFPGSILPGGSTELLSTWMSPAGRVYKMRFASQAEEIAFLRLIVNAYRELQTIRAHAVNVVFREYGCAPKRQAAHALALGDWTQKHIDYVNELPETFSSPLAVLRQRYEDCDGHACFIAACCESIGIPTELEALAWRGPRRPQSSFWERGSWGYRHIFCRALVPVKGKLRRLPLDSTMRGPVGATDPVRTAVTLHGDVESLIV
jgi:transglutaminase-like putative cysteine protease